MSLEEHYKNALEGVMSYGYYNSTQWWSGNITMQTITFQFTELKEFTVHTQQVTKVIFCAINFHLHSLRNESSV